MLGLLQRLPLRVERLLGLLVDLFGGLHLCRGQFHNLLMARQAGLRRGQAPPLRFLLPDDFIQFQLNLPAALLEALQSLGKSEAFHLLLMHLLLQGSRFLPQRSQALVMAAERGLDHMLFGARLAQDFFALAQLGA